jgi:hypothetical protein
MRTAVWHAHTYFPARFGENRQRPAGNQGLLREARKPRRSRDERAEPDHPSHGQVRHERPRCWTLRRAQSVQFCAAVAPKAVPPAVFMMP